MARPVEIDREEALMAARSLFWRQGYSATSMSELLTAMSIGSGSFYSAFGSKADLFKRVVDGYADWAVQQFINIRARHSGLDAIRVFLEKTLIDVSSAGRLQGCLLVNSVLELQGVETELFQYARTALQQLDKQFTACVGEAQSMGTMNTSLSVEDAVHLLTTYVEGLRVESRLGLSKAEARHRVSVLMNLLTAY